MLNVKLHRILVSLGELRINDVTRYVRRRVHNVLRSPVLCLIGTFLILLLVIPLDPPEESQSLVRKVRSTDTVSTALDQFLPPLRPLFEDDPILECPEEEEEESHHVVLETNAHCRVHLLMFGSSRLGNLMIKYSVLYALQQRYNISVYMTAEQHNSLSRHFPKLSIRPPPAEYKNAKWHFTWYRNLEVLLPCPETIGKKFVCFPKRPNEHCIVVADWPPENGFPMFSPYLKRIASEDFIFSRNVQNEVQSYFRKVIGRRKEPVIVGVHVRGTDQNTDFVNNYHRNLPATQYFVTALAYYRAMFRNVVFVVATDEPRFAIRSVVNKFGDVYYTSHNKETKNPVSFDMAMLALSNHTIISVGTFGFWGSYLSGGMVVAPSQYVGDDPDRYDLEIKHWDRQKEWFSWS